MSRLRALPLPSLVLMALTAVSIGAAGAATAAAPATFAKSGGAWQVRLSQQMYQALMAYNPRLRLLTAKDFVPSLIAQYKFTNREVPWAVLGDFNGDGRQDLAVLTYTGTTVVLLAALAEGSTYRISELARIRDGLKDTIEIAPSKTEEGVWNFLRLQPKGVLYSPIEQLEVTLKADSVRFEYWRMSAEVFFWEAGHLRRVRVRPA